MAIHMIVDMNSRYTPLFILLAFIFPMRPLWPVSVAPTCEEVPVIFLTRNQLSEHLGLSLLLRARVASFALNSSMS
jgi:hypothetical protein